MRPQKFFLLILAKNLMMHKTTLVISELKTDSLKDSAEKHSANQKAVLSAQFRAGTSVFHSQPRYHLT